MNAGPDADSPCLALVRDARAFGQCFIDNGVFQQRRDAALAKVGGDPYKVRGCYALQIPEDFVGFQQCMMMEYGIGFDPLPGSPGNRGIPKSAQLDRDLRKGEWLMALNGRYGLTFQADGNLVAYGPKYKVLWNSGTSGHPGAVFKWQADGNAVIYDTDGKALWSSGTWGNPGARFRVQDDGNVVVYRTNGSAAWYTGWDR